MRDYSKFFEDPESFILGFEPNLEEGTIVVEHPNKVTSKYPLERDLLRKIEEKQKAQYEEVIENKKNILIEKYQNNYPEFLLILGSASLVCAFVFLVILLAISAITGNLSAFSTEWGSAFAFLTALGIPTVATPFIIDFYNAAKTNQEYEELELYKEFLENKQKLNELTQINESSINRQTHETSIIDDLSEKAQEIIDKERELYDKKLIDEICNIHLMDKLSLKDLREILIKLKVADESSKPKVLKRNK